MFSQRIGKFDFARRCLEDVRICVVARILILVVVVMGVVVMGVLVVVMMVAAVVVVAGV